jgi:hypothetical protein
VSILPDLMLFDGRWLWIASQTENAVQAIDLTADAEHASPPLNIGVCPECFPSSALGSDGRYLWAGAGDDTVRAIDPVTGEMVDSRTVGWLSFGSMVFDGTRAWVAGAPGRAVRYVAGVNRVPNR